MNPNQLKARLESLSPSTQVEVADLTGTEDHYQAVVISPAFEGKIMIEQHRMVFKLVQAEVDSGEVHALTLKTFTPEQYQKFKSKI
jgi:stress-induced morphogen